MRSVFMLRWVTMAAGLLVAAAWGAEPGPASTNMAPPAMGKAEPLPLELAKAEFELGKKCQAAKNVDLAWFFFRHAVALERLAPKDEKGGQRAEAMQKFVELSHTPDRPERHICPVCEGKKNPTTRFDDLRGSTRRQNKECPRCGTATVIEKPGTITQWRKRVETAGTEFSQVQIRRGRVPVSGAWLPGEWKDKLSVDQRVVLAQGMVAPCPNCAGAGSEDCKTCQGIGEVKCPHCELGLVQDGERKLLRTTVVMLSKCGICKGIGGGLCAKCDGKGRIPCSICKGSGQRPPCDECRGTGLKDCAGCEGTGTRDGKPCPKCGGSGKVQCESCLGDGRKKE